MVLVDDVLEGAAAGTRPPHHRSSAVLQLGGNCCHNYLYNKAYAFASAVFVLTDLPLFSMRHVTSGTFYHISLQA